MAFFSDFPGYFSKHQHFLAFKAHLIPLSSTSNDFALFQLLQAFLCVYLWIILLISTLNPFLMLRTQYKDDFSEYDNTTLTH